MAILKMTDVDLNNQRVLIREDLNVPVENGQVTNDARILAALPTIEYILERNGRVMVMSHLGRPTEGKYEEQYSLAPLVKPLTELLGHPVRLAKDWLQDEKAIPRSGEVVLLENVRFNPGEKSNDNTLARKMASMCDVFVMDAFATAHRAEASTCGIVEFAPFACAGPLLLAEIEALQRAMQKPNRPVAAIVGGSKVSTKLIVLSSLINIVDQLIVGGGIANTFIAACGYSVGRSLYEPDLIPQAQQLMQQAKEKGAAIPIPSDVVVAKDFSPSSQASIKSIQNIAEDDRILDIGPETIAQYVERLKNTGTIIWNGPVGVFEWDAFSKGTEAIAHAIADSGAFSLAGGGDTLAAIDQFDIHDRLSYISTGGGAFLEFLEGKKLPAVAALEMFAEKHTTIKQ